MEKHICSLSSAFRYIFNEKTYTLQKQNKMGGSNSCLSKVKADRQGPKPQSPTGKRKQQSKIQIFDADQINDQNQHDFFQSQQSKFHRKSKSANIYENNKPINHYIDNRNSDIRSTNMGQGKFNPEHQNNSSPWVRDNIKPQIMEAKNPYASPKNEKQQIRQGSLPQNQTSDIGNSQYGFDSYRTKGSGLPSKYQPSLTIVRQSSYQGGSQITAGFSLVHRDSMNIKTMSQIRETPGKLRISKIIL